MTPEQAARARAICRYVQDVPRPEREGFLEATCPDPEVRAEVERLLPNHQDETIITDSPPAPSPFGSNRSTQLPGVILKNRYRIERLLGKGGFAQVFLAVDQELHSRPVVVKVLLDENSSDPWFERRFTEEIRALATIDHPGVVGVLDSGRLEDGAPYLVMQFAEGVTLHSLIKAEPMSFEHVVLLVKQIAHALDAAHEKGVMHRDLKPANIMVQKLTHGEHRVRLIDFGIARLREAGASDITEVSRVVGSLPYMAPEQLTGHGSAASDIYALGVVAFELLTGKRPYPECQPVQLYKLQTSGAVSNPRDLRPDLPAGAECVLLRALSFETCDRPSTARAFSDQLTDALGFGTAPTLAPEAPPAEAAGGSAVQHEVFVGHSSADDQLAPGIVAELERRGIRCFSPPRDLPAGDLVAAALAIAIETSRCFLFPLTENANASEQLKREVEIAIGASRPVLPIRFAGVEPHDDLALLMANVANVDVATDLGRPDYDEIERALRAKVPGLSKSAFVPLAQPPKTAEPAEPLFTEFGALPSLLRTRRVKLITLFFSWTLVNCVLSILANTGYIKVALQGRDAADKLLLRFGYLYELNAALMFLVVAPWFIYFSIGFVVQAQSALTVLAARDQLVVNRMPAHGPYTALGCVAAAHRRWMSRPLLAVLFIGMSLIMAGMEYLPPSSDYKHVMFGYVQAPWIADYPRECPGCTLSELEQKLGRRLQPIGDRSIAETGSYRIVEPYYRRSGSWVESTAFILFMIGVLSLLAVFATFKWWILLKAIFFLRLIYRAVSPSANSPLKLHLRFTAPRRVVGLGPVHRALRQYVAAVMMSAVISILAAWANGLKGSRIAFGSELYSLGGMARFLTSEGAFLLTAALLTYLVAIAGKASDAASERSQQVSAIASRVRGWKDLDRLLHRIAEQSVWRNPGYTLPYLLAPVVCVAAVWAVARLNLAAELAGSWESMLRYVLGTV